MDLEDQIRQNNKQLQNGVASSFVNNEDKLIKGKSVPVGTVAKRPNGMFIKTAEGWKYHSSHNTHSQSQASAGQRSDGGGEKTVAANSGITQKEFDKLHPDTKKQLEAIDKKNSGQDEKKKNFTFMEVLADKEGKSLVEALEHGSSDPAIIKDLKKQLKDKFGYDYKDDSDDKAKSPEPKKEEKKIDVPGVGAKTLKDHFKDINANLKDKKGAETDAKIKQQLDKKKASTGTKVEPSGKVIGSTKSGKPIHEDGPQNRYVKNANDKLDQVWSHDDYSHDDHQDAIHHHEKEYSKLRKERESILNSKKTAPLSKEDKLKLKKLNYKLDTHYTAITSHAQHPTFDREKHASKNPYMTVDYKIKELNKK